MCCKCSSFNGIEKRPKLQFHDANGQLFPAWKQYRFDMLYKPVSEKNNLSYGVESIISVANMYFKPDARISDPEYLRTYNIFKYGDIAFEGNKSKSYANGRFVENTIGDGIVSHVFNVLRPLSPIHNLEYWKYAINNENVMGRILARCTKKTTMMTNLVTSDFMEQEICCPVESEQEKIALFLSLIEKRLIAQEQLVEHLKKYKRGLLDKLLEDNKSDANWHIVRLQDVANGFDYGMNSAATTFDGVHKYIRITDIDDDSRQYLSDDIVSPSDTPEEKYRVCDNDILFARTGASVGKSYLYTLDDGELYFAGFLIRISVKKEYDSYFVYLNTLTSKYGKWLRLESMRSGQPGVNAEQYRNYAFRCPNYQTQVKIANIIKGIDLRILKERMSLSKLNSLKNGLLQQLFI